jgi:hypothetical protein
MPHKRCPSGTRRNKTTGLCEPKNTSRVNSKEKRNKTAKKYVTKALVGKKMPEAQIERIINSEKSLERVGKMNTFRHNEEEYEKKRKAMKELRFDRDMDLSKINYFKKAYENATIASRHHLGVLIGKE